MTLKDISEELKKKLQYFNPTSNGGQNFWSGKLAQNLGKAQSVVESPQKINPIPTINPFRGNNIGSKIGNTVANIPGGMLNTVSQGITSPVMDIGSVIGRTVGGRQLDYNQLRGVGRLGLQIGGLVNPTARQQQNTQYGFKQVAGNIAEVANPIVTAYVPKGIGNVVSATNTQKTLFNSIKQGVSTGTKIGSGYGAISGLESGRETKNNSEYLLNLITNIGSGALVGGAMGGVSSGISSLSKMTKRSPEVETQLRDRLGRWTNGEKITKPNKMPQAQWEFQLAFNKKYQRNPYEPVMPSNLQQAIQIEAEKRVGLQVRDINKDVIKGSQINPKNIKLGQKNQQLPKIVNQPQVKMPKASKKVLPTNDLQFDQLNQSRPIITPTVKERGFVTSVKGAKTVLPKTKSNIEGVYTVKPNTQLSNEASALLTEGAKIDFKNVKDIDKKVAATIKEALSMQKKNPQAAANLFNNLSEQGTELGRGVQAYSMLDKMSPEAIALSAAGKIKKFNATHTNKIPELTGEQLKLISDKVSRIDKLSGRNRNIAINDLQNTINDFIPSSIVDKAITVWKAGLLTSLRTHERNLFGNAIMSGFENLKDLPAVLTDKLLSGKTGARTLTYTNKGVKSGNIKGLKAAKDIIKSGFDPEESISKFDIHRVTWGKNPVEQTLKKYTDFVFRTLGGEDKPFWNASFARSLYDQAGAEAMNAGKTGNAKYIESLVKKPTEKMLKTATIDANYATFHDTNKLSEIANAFKRVAGKSEITKAISEIIAPFTGVPSSIAGKTVAYSPLGLVKGAVTTGKVLLSKVPVPELQRQASQEVGRGVMGTGLFALGSYLMSKGLMTGQPKDQKEGRQWQLENKPYNSVMIGGKWRSINSIGPQSLIVLAGAKYNEEVQNTNGGGIGAFAGQLGKDQLNQTFLAGVQGPLNAITDPTRYGKSYIGNQMSSVVPNIVKDTSKSLDPYARENNTAIDYLKNSIPGVRNMSTPKRDALGNIIPQEPGGIGAFVDLFNSKTPISSPVIDELSRLNLTDNNATPSQISKDQTILKNKVVLNPEQLNKIEAESGTKLRDALNKLISSRGYQSLTDEKKAKAISDTTDSVRTLYKAQYGKDILSDVKLQNASYTTSKDSPQGISRVGLYGTALIDDPKATINAIVSGQPIRKISGKTVVLERQNNLSGLDAGDTTTQVDHKLALALGGTNDPDNLQVLSNEDNAAKGKFETYLAKQLVAGNITKKQAQEMDLDWRNQIGKLPVSEQTKIASAVKLELPESDPNLQFQIVNQTTGNVDNIDLTPIKEPTFTGDDIIDKKLKSAYKSALTRQTNDVIALYQDGQITLEQAKSYISDISSQSTSTKKKTKLTIKISNIKPALISNVKRSAKVKAPTIKFSKPKIKKTNIRRFTIK